MLKKTFIILAVIAALVLFGVLMNTMTRPTEHPTTTTKPPTPTSSSRPTTTVKPGATQAEATWLAGVAAIEHRLTAAWAGPTAPSKARLTRLKNTVHVVPGDFKKLGSGSPRLADAYRLGQDGSTQAAKAEKSYAAALKYLPRKDKAGKRAFVTSVKAADTAYGLARTRFAAAYLAGQQITR